MRFEIWKQERKANGGFEAAQLQILQFLSLPGSRATRVEFGRSLVISFALDAENHTGPSLPTEIAVKWGWNPYVSCGSRTMEKT
jgi:hypothetical protein